MMSLIGRSSTTGSLAALPAALAVNALIAGILAFAVPSTLPAWIPVGITALSMAAAVGLFFLILSKT